jgi:hypothetical protein
MPSRVALPNRVPASALKPIAQRRAPMAFSPPMPRQNQLLARCGIASIDAVISEIIMTPIDVFDSVSSPRARRHRQNYGRQNADDNCSCHLGAFRLSIIGWVLLLVASWYSLVSAPLSHLAISGVDKKIARFITPGIIDGWIER